jgi:uncharacterized membrane protein
MMTGWGEMTLGAWLWMGAWIGALLAMVWVLVHGGGPRSAADDPAEILRARFARGEINQVEYERARRTLGLDTEIR